MTQLKSPVFQFVLLCCLCLYAPARLSAQLKDPGYSLFVSPTFGNRFVVYKGNYSPAYKDSIAAADRWRNAFSGGLMLSFSTGKKQRFYTGLQLLDLGFLRKKENLRFLDTIHPQIGIMNDQSQTGGSYVAFKYRFRYLALPVQFSTRISGKKSKNTLLHVQYGLSLGVLLKHDIRAELHGFSTRGGQKVYILDNSAAQPSRINIQLQSGIRLENLLYGKETWIFVQPELIVPAFAANTGNERYRLLALALQLGVFYKPEQKKQL